MIKVRILYHFITSQILQERLFFGTLFQVKVTGKDNNGTEYNR